MTEFNIGKLVSTLGLDSSEFMRAMTEAENRMKTASSTMSDNIHSIGVRMEATGRKMRSVGTQMSIAITAPLALAGRFALNTASDFEKGMNQVAAVSGAAGSELQQLEDIAREMGATTKFSAVEAAGALNFLAMAGFEVREAITALPSTLKLASAGNMELAESADIVSNVMQGFGLQADQTEKTVDILSKAFTSSNTSLSQLGEAMSYAAPVARAFGQDITTATAAVGFLSDAGIQSTRAGTGLSQSLLQLSKQSEKLGLDIKDASGNLIPLADILEEVEESGLSTGVMIEALGARAGPAFATLMERGSVALREFENELNNAGGTAEEIADIQMQGLSGAMTELNSALSELAIAFMQDILPVLELFADRITKLTNWLSSLDERTRRIIVITTAVAAAMGPVLIIVGQLVIAVGAITKAMASQTIVTRGLISAKTALTRATMALNAAYKANPIGVVIGVVTALAAAIYAVSQRTRGATQAQQEFNETFEEGLRLQEMFQGVSDRVRAINSMNQRQMEALREEIERKIEAEQDYTSVLLGESRRRLEENQQYQRLLAQYTEAQQNAQKENLDSHQRELWEVQAAGLSNRMKLLRESLLGQEVEEHQSSKRRLSQLRDYLNTVSTALEGFSETEEIGVQINFKPIVELDYGAGIFDDLLEEFGRVDDVFKTLEQRMTFIDIKGSLLEDFDELSVKIQATENALDAMIELVAKGEGDPEYLQQLVAELAHLERQAEDAAEKLMFEDVVEQMEQQFNQMREIGATLGDGHMQIVDEFGKYLQQLQNGMDNGLSMTDDHVQELIARLKELGVEFQTLTDGMQQWRNFGVDAANTVGQAMAEIVSDSDRTTSEILSDLLRQVMGMLIQQIVASVPFPANMVVAAGAPILAEGLFQAVGMEQGGQVPPGYPNDTYPALLTSGETVLPPQDLDALISKTTSSVNQVAEDAVRQMTLLTTKLVETPQIYTTQQVEQISQINHMTLPTTPMPAPILSGIQSNRVTNPMINAAAQQSLDINIVGKLEGETIALSNDRFRDRFNLVE